MVFQVSGISSSTEYSATVAPLFLLRQRASHPSRVITGTEPLPQFVWEDIIHQCLLSYITHSLTMFQAHPFNKLQFGLNVALTDFDLIR